MFISTLQDNYNLFSGEVWLILYNTSGVGAPVAPNLSLHLILSKLTH